MPDGQGVKCISLPAGISHFQKFLGYFPGAITMVGIQIKDNPHNFGFFLIDRQHTILFVVAIEFIVAQHMTILDCLPKTKFQSLRQLSHLILGNTRHNNQAEFTIGVQGVDVVILKENTHIVLQQFLCVLDTVQCRTGKPGDFLGDDEVK